MSEAVKTLAPTGQAERECNACGAVVGGFSSSAWAGLYGLCARCRSALGPVAAENAWRLHCAIERLQAEIERVHEHLGLKEAQRAAEGDGRAAIPSGQGRRQKKGTKGAAKSGK